MIQQPTVAERAEKAERERDDFHRDVIRLDDEFRQMRRERDEARDCLEGARLTYMAALADVERLAASLKKLEPDHLTGCANELGEDYIRCNECDATDWGSIDVYNPGDMDHDDGCPFAALAATARTPEGA